jgi:secreted PhoX family phosphatase
VSRLRLNQTDGSIIGAELIINGSEGYQRFCSASLVEGYGFEHPTFFTNEEVDDGIVLAIDAVNETITEMPWLGKFSHENTIHVPLFSNTVNKTVVLSFEDGDATESEVYIYVADTPRDLLSGKGKLYVFGASGNTNTSTAAAAENKSSYSSWDDIYFSNGVVSGKFIPLTWDYKTQNETELDNEAIAVGGFQFIRPEDGAMNKREGMQNILYMAETGSDKDENEEIISLGNNGQNWTNGRIINLHSQTLKIQQIIDLYIVLCIILISVKHVNYCHNSISL